jgi:hypothetical protein
MSLLSVVSNAMTLCGLPAPTVVFSSSNNMIEQFLRLVYVEGRYLMKRHDWNKLITVETLACAATNEQTGYPVAAFERMSRGVDVWNTSSDWPIHGPADAEQWNDLVVRTIVSLPQYWRLIGGVLNIYAPRAGDDIRFEYITKNWIYQTGTTPSQIIIGDTDIFAFPENLMELGLVWRWKKSKQLDYAEDMRDYEIALTDEIDSDRGGRKVISTDRDRPQRPFNTWHGTVTAV